MGVFLVLLLGLGCGGVWAEGLDLSQYVEEEGAIRCGTPFLAAAKVAQGRPLRQVDFVSASGRFRVHYDTSGRHGVDPVDGDGSGVPDYVEAVGRIADSVWVAEVEVLGYRPPLEDGDGQWDIYLSELGLGTAYYGLAHPEAVAPARSTGYIELDNNFTDPAFLQRTSGLDALRITMAHEFFHLVQFGYYSGEDDCWWQEGTAVWIEEALYPAVDDYLIDLPLFFEAPERGLDRGSCQDARVYSTSIFAHFLAEKFSPDLIRQGWEVLREKRSAAPAHFNSIIPGGLDRAVSDFARWNLFTGRRHSLQPLYREGAKYPQVRTVALEARPKVAVLDSGFVDRLASKYFVLQPDLRPGGARIHFEVEGAWRAQLVTVGGGEAQVRPLAEHRVTVVDWDRYDEIVLVLSLVESVGGGFDYEVVVEYDPQLNLEAPPLALGLEPTYPNPFRPGRDAFVTFPFALERASRQTALSVFSLDGQLVRRLELGARSARRFSSDRWDGRNNIGELVQSGIYYYVLETDSQHRRGKMAVLGAE